jgi:hypothetical protein
MAKRALKKALLVTYQPGTRIVVDIPEGMTVEDFTESSKGICAIHRRLPVNREHGHRGGHGMSIRRLSTTNNYKKHITNN